MPPGGDGWTALNEFQVEGGFYIIANTEFATIGFVSNFSDQSVKPGSLPLVKGEAAAERAERS